MKTSRRSFLITSIGAVSALALSREALADAPMLAESDPTATALGYKADATKVDKTKYPKYAAGQDCAACMLYQGKKGSASGPCGALWRKPHNARRRKTVGVFYCLKTVPSLSTLAANRRAAGIPRAAQPGTAN
jgi:High potential iron-sulfur protein